MLACLRSAQTIEEVVTDLVREAVRIHLQDIENNREIGGHGAKLIPWGSSALTHCNTGALATGGYGTAVGIIRTAWRDGRLERVYATETRPLLQGARLTAWELVRDGVEACLLGGLGGGYFDESGDGALGVRWRGQGRVKRGRREQDRDVQPGGAGKGERCAVLRLGTH